MEWKTKLENCQTVTDIIAMLMLAGIKGDSICCDSVLFIVERAVKNERNAGLEEAAKVAENHGTNKDAPSSFYDDMDWCYIVDDVAAAIRKTINRTQGGTT